MYLAYKYSLTLDTSAFFLALTASGIIIVLSAMASEEGDSNDTNSLIREMLKQVSTLQEKVDAIQKKSVTPSEVGDSAPADGTGTEKEADFEAESFFEIYGGGQQKFCFFSTNVVWGRIC